MSVVERAAPAVVAGAGWSGPAPSVGARARRSRRVEAEDIARFTEISGDRNPLHYDEAAARASRFGEIVVQGGVTTALLNALVAEQLPGPGSVFLRTDYRFEAPVRPGDTLTAEAEVVAVRDDAPITTLRVQILRDDGTRVLSGTAVCYTMTLG